MKTEEEKLGQEPAFATSAAGEGEVIYEAGMSKRFYAACAAMQGMLASPFDIEGGKSELIKKSFEYADELLKQE